MARIVCRSTGASGFALSWPSTPTAAGAARRRGAAARGRSAATRPWTASGRPETCGGRRPTTTTTTRWTGRPCLRSSRRCAAVARPPGPVVQYYVRACRVCIAVIHDKRRPHRRAGTADMGRRYLNCSGRPQTLPFLCDSRRVGRK